MGVIFARQSPGCTIVTCSVTSEGLANFLQKDLGLRHVRHVKGYANVIHRARGLSESGEANAEVAIETSGHCALKENDYLDDGTYTAVKTVALLAREKAKDPNTSLLSLINGMKEMNEVAEIRMAPMDESLESTSLLYDFAALEVENACGVVPGWSLDTENLEGIRVSNGKEGSFFMLRKSLHDPVLSIQIEASSKESATATIVEPIIRMFESEPQIQSALDFSSLKDYAGDQ
jgi:phosphomannomutase